MSLRFSRSGLLILVLVGTTTASSCALLSTFPAAGAINPPAVQFQGATLAGCPTQRGLGAYYCPDVVSDPLGIPGGAAALCRGFFGVRPTPAEMNVAFDLHFKISNPNKIPVPLAQVLAAVTVFPDGGNRNMGAVCMQLCAPGQVGCTGLPDPTACQASSRDVHSMSDFGNGAARFVIASGIAAAAGQPPTFVAPQVASGGDLDVTIRYSFGPEELLGVLRQVASQSVSELKSGRPVTFSIPFRVEGTVWFDAGSLGRLPVSYGPLEGVLALPTEGLLPS
jgi:hypothetical protein